MSNFFQKLEELNIAYDYAQIQNHQIIIDDPNTDEEIKNQQIFERDELTININRQVAANAVAKIKLKVKKLTITRDIDDMFIWNGNKSWCTIDLMSGKTEFSSNMGICLEEMDLLLEGVSDLCIDELVNITKNELKNHLELQYGKGIHIDYDNFFGYAA